MFSERSEASSNNCLIIVQLKLKRFRRKMFHEQCINKVFVHFENFFKEHTSLNECSIDVTEIIFFHNFERTLSECSMLSEDVWVYE